MLKLLIIKLIRRFNSALIKLKLKRCGKNLLVGSHFSIREPKNICIGDNFFAEHYCSIASFEFYNGIKQGKVPIIVIGNNVTLSAFSLISASNKIIIGDGCLFGVNTFISDHYHGDNNQDQAIIEPSKRNLYSKGPIQIGKNVWTGRNVCVMPNVTIGDYAVIGANSVVTHDIPPYAIAAGTPAKVIKMIK